MQVCRFFKSLRTEERKHSSSPPLSLGRTHLSSDLSAASFASDDDKDSDDGDYDDNDDDDVGDDDDIYIMMQFCLSRKMITSSWESHATT